MTKQKPKKITLDQFIKSTTMFYIDRKLEKKYSENVNKSVSELKTQLFGIGTIVGLKKYIREEENSLDRIISLLNISEERFKRIITMLRIQKCHIPSGDWSLKKVRESMLAKPDFMNEICELLSNGESLDKYKSLIPEFYIDKFIIDASTIGRLANPDDLRRLVKKGLEGRYNNSIGDSFFKYVTDIIKKYCDKAGLTYAVKKEVPMLGKNISIAIPDENNPRLLIDITYGITTSSSQTKYAKQVENTMKIIREKNIGKTDEQKLVYINVVDGAGWIARQSDLNKIERCSDYMLNLKNLDTVNNIINYYFNQEN